MAETQSKQWGGWRHSHQSGYGGIAGHHEWQGIQGWLSVDTGWTTLY